MQITHDLAIGGLQQVVVNLCKSIDRERFDISVLCLRALGDFVQDLEEIGVPVFFIEQPQSGTDYFSFLKVAKILRQQKIEVIHTHNTQPLLDGTIAYLMSGVKKIIHTDHARAFPDKKRYMVAEKIASFFVDKMVGVSDDTKNNLYDFEKIALEKLEVIHNGIDINRYKKGIDLTAKRKELKIKDSGPIIGMVGRLSEEKGVVFLIKALPKILQRIPDLNLVIAGDGPQKDLLRNEISKLDITNNVKVLGSRLDIPEILNLLDILVLPSLREGLPMVLLEAMAAGCAIIASNVGGIPTLIKDNWNGNLVSPGSIDEIANAVINLVSNEAKQKEYSKNSETILDEFSLSNMVHKYESLYLI